MDNINALPKQYGLNTLNKHVPSLEDGLVHLEYELQLYLEQVNRHRTLIDFQRNLIQAQQSNDLKLNRMKIMVDERSNELKELGKQFMKPPAYPKGNHGSRGLQPQGLNVAMDQGRGLNVGKQTAPQGLGVAMDENHCCAENKLPHPPTQKKQDRFVRKVEATFKSNIHNELENLNSELHPTQRIGIKTIEKENIRNEKRKERDARRKIRHKEFQRKILQKLSRKNQEMNVLKSKENMVSEEEHSLPQIKPNRSKMVPQIVIEKSYEAQQQAIFKRRMKKEKALLMQRKHNDVEVTPKKEYKVLMRRIKKWKKKALR